MTIEILLRFHTSKGVGFTLSVLGNCLVVTVQKMKSGRGFTKCVKVSCPR